MIINKEIVMTQNYIYIYIYIYIEIKKRLQSIIRNSKILVKKL